MTHHFRLLGPVTLCNDASAAHLGRSKHVAVLAALLLQAERPVAATRLADLVWGDPATPKSTLHPEINRVRRLLESHGLGSGRHLLGHSGGHYTLHIAAERVDWHRFRQALQQAEHAAARGHDEQAMSTAAQALQLWQGEPFGGLEGGGLDNLRTEMRESHRRAVRLWAHAGIRAGRHSAVLSTLQAHHAENPFDEGVARDLMRALHRCGRTTEALEVAGRLLHTLREHGMHPAAETRELQSRIARHDPALAPPGASPPVDHTGVVTQPMPAPRFPSEQFTLPRDVPELVGREAPVARILATPDQERPSGQVWVLSGMPGVGKTTLAVYAAHRLRRRFPDAHLMVRLAGHAHPQPARTPEDVLHGLLRAVGVTVREIPEEQAARSALWRRRTAGLRMLLLLDDAASSEQVAPLLPEGPQCLVLVTSRHRLTGLQGSRAVVLDPLTEDEAVRLFRVQAQDSADDDDRLAVAEVVRRCTPLPLAVCLAAARLREHSSWSAQDLASLLRSSPEPLHEIRSGTGDIAAAFAGSLDALNDADRRALLCLALIAGTEYTAETAAGLLALPVGTADRVLERLHRASLIEEPAPGRYRLHDLVGAYARSEARRRLDFEERREAVARLLDTYLARADDADRKLYPHRRRLAVTLRHPPGAATLPTTQGARHRLTTEQDTYVAATTAARDYGLERYTGQLAHVLFEHLKTTHRSEAALRLCGDAVDIWMEFGEWRWLAQALLGVSRVWLHRGMHEAALDTAERARRICAELGDDSGAGDAVDRIGTVLAEQGRHADALEHHLRAREHFRDTDAAAAASTLTNANKARIELGRYAEAMTGCEEALRLYRKVGYRIGEVAVLNDKARIFQEQGRLDPAYELFAQAKALLVQENRRWELCFVANNLGEVALARGDAPLALEHCEQALLLAEETGETNAVATIRANLAEVMLTLGDSDQAQAIHEHTRDMLDRGLLPDNVDARRQVLRGLGEVLRAKGEDEQADAYCLQAAAYAVPPLRLPRTRQWAEPWEPLVR